MRRERFICDACGNETKDRCEPKWIHIANVKIGKGRKGITKAWQTASDEYFNLDFCCAHCAATGLNSLTPNAPKLSRTP